MYSLSLVKFACRVKPQPQLAVVILMFWPVRPVAQLIMKYMSAENQWNDDWKGHSEKKSAARAI